VGSIDRYLDASFLVALLTAEPSSLRAIRFVRAYPGGLVVSDLAAAEFASAISRRVRMRQMPQAEGQLVLSAFDRWMVTGANGMEISSADIAVAAVFLRRLDLALRTPDAIHIATAQRLAATLITFDQRMATAARALGVAVADL
jgi:hypothetical protein